MLPSREFTKIAAIGGTIAAAVCFAYAYLKKQQPTQQISAKTLSLQTTKKMVQEIKYQMLLLCMTFTEKFAEYLQANLNERQLQILQVKLRENMSKFYEQKETIIMDKYQVSNQTFAEAIQLYHEDQSIKKNQEDIQVMMQGAVKGKLPDFQVPEEALLLLNVQQIRQIYQELSFNVARLVWNKMIQFIRQDPTFDTKIDADFRRAIRTISLYDYKMIFLQEKGFQRSWGCPNQTFFKVIQINKRKHPQFKERIICIERAYEVIIDKVSHFPEEMTEEGLKLLFQAKINNNEKISKPKLPVVAKKAKLNKISELTDEFKQFISNKQQKEAQKLMNQQTDKDVQISEIKLNINPVAQW